MTLEQTIDPGDLGFDPARLARISEMTHAYVDDGRMPFVHTLVTRGGQIAHHDYYGFADRERKRPYTPDSIVRLYSQTKPITCVALMTLYEQGRVLLEDPVSKYLPAFADGRVFVSGNDALFQTREVEREITVQDLMRHTSGLTYGFQNQHPVDAIYRREGLDNLMAGERSLPEIMDVLGRVPLQFSPGTKWCYGMGIDVAGAIIEVITGQRIDHYFRDTIFEPLGMVDTAFWVADDGRRDRFTSNYFYQPDGSAVFDPFDKSSYFTEPSYPDPGGGLVSTMADYHRFSQMLLGRGQVDGVRILGSRTVDYLASNHLPGGQTMNDMDQVGFAEGLVAGLGFGLGVSVNVSPTENGAMASVGEYGWAGAASTAFRVDPSEEMTFQFQTQLIPSSAHPLRRQLYATIYQSMID